MLKIFIMTDKKIALFAGALSLPFFTRDALRRAGYTVFVIGLKNFYDPKLKPDMEIRLGNGGAAAREMKKRGIRQMTFVGAIGHPDLSDIWPDWWSISILWGIHKNQRGYDSMATTLINALEKKGFTVLASQLLAPELAFTKPGVQTKTKPTIADKRDIERAVDVSHIIGAADIGASVVVDKQVIAVEAAEGTAEMLNRVTEFRARRKRKTHSGVFAKMTKPGQDIRIDAAAIGVDTVRAVAAAQLRGIVVDSKTCFVVDKENVIKLANELKIFIVAM